ncbi:succinate semialdehyde dehydrogenase [Cerioporus squamosus]|nr:succinate semialdehyde dehydrogenase [Cerioporus squamosus]
MSLNPAGTVLQLDTDPTSQTTLIPHNQQPLVIRTYPSETQLERSIQYAAAAQEKWARVPLKQRIEIGRRFMEEFGKMRDEIPLELTLQMGRPVTQGAGEIRGTLERAEYLLSIAEKALADVTLEDTDKPGFRRFIKRAPLGVVLVIAPWNYPYLVMVNSVLPALIAGNAVILKPSPQTPLAAERFALAFHNAGVPRDALQVIHLSPELTTKAVKNPLVDFIAFTGSVAGGRAVDIAAAEAPGFKGVGLELGGKDPAYVRADADLDYTVPELVDGAMFNSGQSCCAIERIYVHEDVYDEFVKRYVELTKKYRLGDPTEKEYNIGPVCSIASAERIRKQVAAAVAAGAKALIPEDLFPAAQPYWYRVVAPQVLVDVNHCMLKRHQLLTLCLIQEETFGPVVGIQKVVSDDEAIALMNDSPYGLTASVWTNAAANPDSEKAFLTIMDELQTGTVFLNRCDYLDPALAWTGVKNSGRGVSLSKFGYDQLTRAKSVHMKIKTSQ